METPTTPITSKQILYTILLNSDTETIVEEYILGYLKTHPELHRKYVKEITHPLATIYTDTYNRLHQDLCNKEQETTDNPIAHRFVFTQSLYHLQVPLTQDQVTHMFSLLTPEQLEHINTRLDKGQHWF